MRIFGGGGAGVMVVAVPSLGRSLVFFSSMNTHLVVPLHNIFPEPLTKVATMI